MVIWQVSLPFKVSPEHLSEKTNPAAGGSANSTDAIFMAALPLVPKVKTFFASVPKTTSPIGIGSGVAVKGISLSMVENSIP